MISKISRHEADARLVEIRQDLEEAGGMNQIIPDQAITAARRDALYQTERIEVSYSQSAIWQKEALVPEECFNAYLLDMCGGQADCHRPTGCAARRKRIWKSQEPTATAQTPSARKSVVCDA